VYNGVPGQRYEIVTDATSVVSLSRHILLVQVEIE
jgi:hypothetical protein